jgi:hypothetical protein
MGSWTERPEPTVRYEDGKTITTHYAATEHRDDFGFTVRRKDKRWGLPGSGKRYQLESGEFWTVSLPHQCDDWEIAGYKEAFGEGRPVTREEAIEDLSTFIAEAVFALEHLKRAEELDDD